MTNYLIKNPDCVFIHIPKTGGTSIRNIKKDVLKVVGREALILPEWSNHFKFAFVRNPYDRLVSAWYFFGGEKRMSFLDFLKIATNDSIPHKNIQKLNSNIRYHTISQIHPDNNLQHADFIGYFETFQNDFDTICDILSTPHIKLPHKNKTKHEHHSTYYNDQSVEIVSKYYRGEIAQFGYMF